jgi:hypothetical protein
VKKFRPGHQTILVTVAIFQDAQNVVPGPTMNVVAGPGVPLAKAVLHPKGVQSLLVVGSVDSYD